MKRLILALIFGLSILAFPTTVHAGQATPPAVINQFNPYDGSTPPPLGIYEVAPLSGTYLAIYTDPKHPNNWFPATFFALWNESKTGFTLDFDYCPHNIIFPLIKKLNTAQGFNYLTSYPDGINFNSGYRGATVFPLNTVRVTKVLFRKPAGGVSQWWGQIETLPCNSSLSTIDPASIPSEELQHQSDMTYNSAVKSGIELMGFDAISPLVSTHTVYVPFTQLEVVNALISYEVINTGGWNLNLRSGPGTSYAIIGKLPEYSIVTYDAYSEDGEWVEVTDANGNVGWASMQYLIEE